MAKQNRTILKTYFNTGDRPTELNFADFIDSKLNIQEDKAVQADIDAGTNDEKYITPLGAKIAARKHITVNGSTTDANGNIQINNVTGTASTITGTITKNQVTGLDTDLNAKQATLVSGSNIKTVGGTTILGTGDIPFPIPTAPITITGNAGTATKLQTPRNINGISFDGSVDVFTQKIVTLAANFTSTSLTRVNVPNLSFNIVAGKKYKIEIIGDFSATVLTTGGSLGFILSSGTGSVKGFASLQTSTATANNLGLKMSITALGTTAVNTTSGSFITSTGVSPISVPHNLYANLVLTCITNGVFQVQWGSEVAASTTLNLDTIMIVTQLN
jgi:hypothetical protein